MDFKEECIVCNGTIEEMIELWGYADKKLSSTATYFVDCINGKRAVFYTMEYKKQCIGELYVFFELRDKDFANEMDRAYLCAFRINKEYQHQGLGTKLIQAVMEILKEQGIKEVTIGVDETEEDNIHLYRRLGFSQKVKDCFEDPCNVNENMEPVKCNIFWLLKKAL